MDESEFFRGIEGERQNQEDLVSGAEHFIRLKKQVGIENSRDDDLELEKKGNKTLIGAVGTGAAGGVFIKSAGQGELAGFLANSNARMVSNSQTHCPNCRKEKDACLCKMASVLFNARVKTAGAAESIRKGLEKRPYTRAAVLGGLTSGIMGGAYGAIRSPDTGLKERVKSGLSGASDGAISGSTGGMLYHFLNSKLASLREKTASSILEQIKNVHPGLAITTGLGTAMGGIGTYLASRPQKDTGKSRAEESLEGKVNSQKDIPERGLLSKMHHRNTELEHGYAKAFREHPGKAALIGSATGALGGYSLGRLAGALHQLRGK